MQSRSEESHPKMISNQRVRPAAQMTPAQIAEAGPRVEAEMRIGDITTGMGMNLHRRSHACRWLPTGTSLSRRERTKCQCSKVTRPNLSMSCWRR
jgi:hypothetical protein